ncbi:MAG TPA: DNA polymerase III subunit gamma/tau, partial [Novosphingobium sp.]|nr:DNA polymerase III subunit gamma/tau [Novosphingobium sp.]
AADLPDPGQLARRIEQMAASGAVLAAAGGPGPDALPGGGAEALAPALSWDALVEQVEESGLPGGMTMASMMRVQVRVIELAQGRLVFAQPPEFRDDLGPEMRAMLQKVSGQLWHVERQAEGGAPTLDEAHRADVRARGEAERAAPLVAAALAAFPAAEIIRDEPGAPQRPRQANWRN